MFADFSCVQIRKQAIAEVFQDQRLASIAHNDPITRSKLHLCHRTAPRPNVSIVIQIFRHFFEAGQNLLSVWAARA